jgi:selenide,water dikinase
MTIDLKRRQKVMARSQTLQHCICDPKQRCPCDTFIGHNVCPCAGEKMPLPAGPVALTRTVAKAGCASKIAQGDLIRILRSLPPICDPKVLLGAAAGDDCGVYDLGDGSALVQTVDVFTPCVDDPYLFGQIAAANSLSDVYAMGGRPVTALSVVGFPIDDFDGGLMEDMLRGGIDKLNEAGCALIGGHSISDKETKMGFAVTGLIECDRVVQRDRARAGDALVLTKPLGTGMIAFGVQIGRLNPRCLEEAGVSMATLNRDAAELMREFQAHACTDVTGFGLAGHLVEMVRTSSVSAEVDLSRVPVFAAVKECLDREILPGSIERNQEYAMAWIRVAGTGGEENLPILYDPQTSGGLLVSLPEEKAPAYVEAMRRRGHASASVIGRITPRIGPESEIRIVNARLGHFIGNSEEIIMQASSGPQKKASDAAHVHLAQAECCASPPAFEEESTADDLALFMDFMAAANRPGLIDARAKKLMAIALSVVQRCEPCLKSHMKSALSMGITREEIDEAARLAIAFGGCTAMMFYRENCSKPAGNP